MHCSSNGMALDSYSREHKFIIGSNPIQCINTAISSMVATFARHAEDNGSIPL